VTLRNLRISHLGHIALEDAMDVSIVYYVVLTTKRHFVLVSKNRERAKTVQTSRRAFIAVLILQKPARHLQHFLKQQQSSMGTIQTFHSSSV
jgi:predicted transcriptional regulator